MTTFLEQMQFASNAGLAQRFEEGDQISDRHLRIVDILAQEAGRHRGRDMMERRPRGGDSTGPLKLDRLAI